MEITERFGGGVIVPYVFWGEYDIVSFLEWAKKNRPKMMHDVMCEECPEHIGDIR